MSHTCKHFYKSEYLNTLNEVTLHLLGTSAALRNSSADEEKKEKVSLRMVIARLFRWAWKYLMNWARQESAKSLNAKVGPCHISITLRRGDNSRKGKISSDSEKFRKASSIRSEKEY